MVILGGRNGQTGLGIQSSSLSVYSTKGLFIKKCPPKLIETLNPVALQLYMM